MNSASVAILVLVLIAAALLCAALYALFGKPSTSVGRKRKQEVRDGFQLAGGILLGFVLMGSLVALTTIAFGATSNSLQVSRFFAGVIAFAALVVIGLMVQRWAKYFVGWIAYSIFNGFMMVSSGHLLNNPAVPVKRSVALSMTVLCFVTVLVTQRFTKAYKLHLGEKLALMAWIVGFTLAVVAERFSIPALATGTFALVFAWWWHRSHSQRLERHSTQRREPTLEPPNNY